MNNEKFHTVRGYQLMEQSNRLLTPAMEDYLEMIYRYSQQEGYIRINKLAEQLNVKASSASRMVQRLGELRMLKYERYGIITLTEKGRQIGSFLLTRHTIIESFLRTIGSGDNLYETELIEHNISLETLRNINLLNKFLEANPEIMDRFNEYRAIHSGKDNTFP